MTAEKSPKKDSAETTNEARFSVFSIFGGRNGRIAVEVMGRRSERYEQVELYFGTMTTTTVDIHRCVCM